MSQGQAMLIALAGLFAVGFGAMQLEDGRITTGDIIGQLLICSGTLTVVLLVRHLARRNEN